VNEFGVKVMSLWWVVREVDGERRFYFQEADTPMYAGLKSAIAGFEGDLKEVLPIDAKTAKRIKKKDIGRVLSFEEGKKIIEGME
jgi:hypothetical protein